MVQFMEKPQSSSFRSGLWPFYDTTSLSLSVSLSLYFIVCGSWCGATYQVYVAAVWRRAAAPRERVKEGRGKERGNVVPCDAATHQLVAQHVATRHSAEQLLL